MEECVRRPPEAPPEGWRRSRSPRRERPDHPGEPSRSCRRVREEGVPSPQGRRPCEDGQGEVVWISYPLWAFVVTLLVANVTFSQTGRMLRAIREDEIAAEASAVQTTRLKVMAFSLSAAFAGIAGGLFAHMQAGVRPDDFRFEKSVDMLVMIIVGGLGSITGAVIGGVFLAVSLEAMRDLEEYRLILYACLLVLIMIVRPQGLLGRRELSLRALLLGKKRARSLP